MLPTKFQVNWSFVLGEELDFHAGDHGGHVGYPIGTTLANFNLQVILMLLTEFKLVGLLVQEKKR